MAQIDKRFINNNIAGSGLNKAAATDPLSVDTDTIATKAYVDSKVTGLNWKELVLHDDQLDDAEGLLPATVVTLAANLVGDDVLNLKMGSASTETFTAGEEFAVGANVNATLANLAVAINAGTDFTAVVVTDGSLSEIGGAVADADHVLVIYRSDDGNPDDALRIWDSGSTNLRYIDFDGGAYIGDSSDLEALPAADPTDTNFGIGRELTDLTANECHFARDADIGYSWDGDSEEWMAIASGTYTEGDGVNITGSAIAVDLAENQGLEFSSGELKTKLDGSSLSVGADGLRVASDSIMIGLPLELTLDGADVTAGFKEINLGGPNPAFAQQAVDSYAMCDPVGGCAQDNGADFVIGRGSDDKVWFIFDSNVGGGKSLPANYTGSVPSSGMEDIVAASDVIRLGVTVYQV
jgi:hypothetical protein